MSDTIATDAEQQLIDQLDNVVSINTQASQELLNKTDEQQLQDLLEKEKQIENLAAAAFYRIGMFLADVKENEKYKLVREEPLDGKYSFITFEEYCETRFGYKSSYVSDLIRGALALDEMMKVAAQRGSRARGDLPYAATLPRLEYHIRPLLALETPQERVNVWNKTKEDYNVITHNVLTREVKAYIRNRDRDYQTIEEWKADPWPIPEETTKTFNKQTDNNIEWAQFSWNPVTGCNHDCSYCYARDIQNHYYPEKNFTPSRHPSRLMIPYKQKVPEIAETDIAYKNVFTCSMADLFGRWVPEEWINEVLDVCVDNAQWNFLFLTKFPNRYQEFHFPENVWLGTSVDCQARVANAEKAFENVTGTKWLSIEPLLEPIKFNHLDRFDWVVIGGASRSSKTPEWIPPLDWFMDIYHQAREAGCKIYVKDNLPYFNEEHRLREFPWCEYEQKQLPESFKYMKSIK